MSITPSECKLQQILTAIDQPRPKIGQMTFSKAYSSTPAEVNRQSHKQEQASRAS